MRTRLARAIMAVALCCMPADRREWAAAMAAEFEAAVADGKPLSFAGGCLIAAWRELLTREEGRFTLTNYALVFGVMMPMAALQVGCALFGLPYLYPDRAGLPGALLEGATHEGLIRGVYQAAVPSLALLLLVAGIGHFGMAWAILDRDWARAVRRGAFTLAATIALIGFMGVLFLDGTQALLQGAILAIELATVALVARWQRRLPGPAAAEHPG